MESIDPNELYWFTSSNGRIEFQMPGECLMDICQPGPADEAVAYWRGHEIIGAALDALDPATVQDELREFGAWDADELADHDANLDRLLWTAACSAAEEVRYGGSDDSV